MSPRHILLAIVLVAVWGTNFVALKWSLVEIPPFLLTALRYTFTALPAIFFIRKPAVSWRFMMLYATVVGILQFSLAFTGLKLGMPAGLSSIVVQTQAFFTFLLAVWLLGERPGPIQILGGLIAFGGIGVIALERFEPTALIPLLLMLASAFCWGASNIITKKAGKIDMLGLVVWSALLVPVPMLILSLLFEGGFGIFGDVAANLTLRGGLSVMFTAYLSTLFGYGVWAILLSKYPANTVAPFTLLVPIFGMGSAYLLLRETITSIEIIGSVLVFAGLIVNVFGPRLFLRRAAKSPDVPLPQDP
jgi:O-acetylserine/cysteine efflux transporter